MSRSRRRLTRQELLLRARPNLVAARRKLEDPDVPLTSSDRLVLDFVCAEIERRCLERVTLPWRAVCDVTGLGERKTKNSLRRLVEGRHLLVAVRGRAGGSASRRATIYRLPDAPVPENGSMGPPAQFYGTPLRLLVGTPSGESVGEQRPSTTTTDS